MEKTMPRVLVVDDDPPVRKLARACLEAMGLGVEEAACGKTALAKLAAAAPALVCLELALPELSGYDVCEFIRRSPSLRDVPVLMMSDHSYPEDRAYALEAGAAAFLAKPFTPKTFAESVRRLLQGVGGPS